MNDPDLNLTLDLIGRSGSIRDSVAVAMPGSDLTYAQLDRLAWRAAQHLHDHGVRRGDVIALTFGNEALLGVALLGSMRLGATAMTIARSATPFLRGEWARQARCKLLVSDAPQRHATGIPALSLTGSDLPAGARVDLRLMDERPAAPCLIAVGSGTTGRAKLIPVTHAQMRGRCRLSEVTQTYTPQSRALYLSNLEFSSIQTYFFSVLHLGATFCIRGGSLDGLVEDCIRREIDVLSLSVFHAESILRGLPPGQGARFGFLRALRIGGSTVSDDLRSRIRSRMTENLHVGYGTNECLFISVATPPEVFDVPGTIGHALPGVSVEVVDEARQPVAPGTIGQLRVRSPALFGGYLDDEAATERALVDGWFHPGDLVRVEPGGALVHCGRADEMMIMNGINIYPTEIEQCLVAHPEVSDAAVLAIRHPVHQDVPVCAVSLVPDAMVTEEDLRAFARDRLGFRAPYRVVILESVPRNDLGKVIRPELSRSLAQAMR